VPPRRNLKRKKPVYAESSSDDDTPLASSPLKQSTSAAVYMPGAADATTAPLNGSKVKSEDISDESSDSRTKKKPIKKKVKREDDSDNEPLLKKTASRKRKVKEESDVEMSDDMKPVSTKKTVPKKPKQETDADSKPKKGKTVKEEPASPTKGKGKKKQKDDEEEEDVYRWWDAGPDADGSVKWQTLEHNGVIFPPPYEPLPSHIKMKYDGKSLVCGSFLPFIYFHRQRSRPSTRVRRSRRFLCSLIGDRPRPRYYFQ